MLDFGPFPALLAQTSPNGPSHSPGSLLIFLVHPKFTWTLVVFILSIGLFFWYRFSVEGIARAIAAVKDATGILKRRAADGQFIQNLDTINKLLVSNPVVGRAWSHYTDSLLVTSEGSVIRSGRDPHYYFNDGLLAEIGLNLRFYYAVPSYLVGLGLLCTFLGLVVALFIASMTLASDQDIKTILFALQNLLQAAAFKFITSIAGLGSSLLFSSATRGRLMDWQNALDAFCNELQSAAPVISAETLAYETLVEQQRQTAHLARAQTDLAQQFATALDARLQANLGKLVDPLTEHIQQVTLKLGTISHDAVTQMVQEFRAELFAASREQMQQLMQGLQATTGTLEQMNAGIARSADYFSHELGRATEEVYQRITKASLAFETSLEPLHQEVRALNETFTQVDNRFKSQLNLFSAAVEGMHTTLQEFRKTAKVLEGVSTPIQNATQELDAVARRIHESNVASMHALEQLAKFSDSLNRTAQQTRETWDVYRQRFEKVDEDLKGVVDQLGRGFRSYHDIVESFMKQLDQSLSHSTNVLSSSVQELAETLENIEARSQGPGKKA
jgi:methyl-accepting chemotaxis protein